MSAIVVKRNTSTNMKISKATIDDEGRFIVDGEVVDLVELVKEFFEGVIFDVSITEKVEEKLTEN